MAQSNYTTSEISNLSQYYHMTKVYDEVYRMALDGIRKMDSSLRWDFEDEEIAEAVKMIISKLNMSDSDTIRFRLGHLDGWFTNGKEYTRVILIDEYENRAEYLDSHRNSQMIDLYSFITDDEVVDIILALENSYNRF